MNTGWRAASDSRRPHKTQELRMNGGKSTVSKRRRQSVKDSNSAMRLRGQLVPRQVRRTAPQGTGKRGQETPLHQNRLLKPGR